MPSNKPKVFAYLPQELYNHVSEFKIQHQLPSDSQALIAILTEFFDCPKPKIPVSTNASNALEQRVEQLERMFDSLNLMVLGLLHANPLNEREETNDSVPGELDGTDGSVPGELEETDGSVPGELHITDGSVPGELDGTDGSVPGELHITDGSVPGELDITDGSVPGELEETDGSVPGELDITDGSVPGELEETDGSVPGELDITDGSVPGELDGTDGSVPSELGVTSGSVPDKDQRFVLCRFKIETPNNPLYWRSQRDGFIENLHKAKTYQLRGMVTKQIERLKEDPDYALYPNERLSYKTFGELKQMQAEVNIGDRTELY